MGENLPEFAWGQAKEAKFNGAGSPNGVVTPGAVGDLYIDETNGLLWQATSTSNTGWQLVSKVSSLTITKKVATLANAAETDVADTVLSVISEASTNVDLSGWAQITLSANTTALLARIKGDNGFTSPYAKMPVSGPGDVTIYVEALDTPAAAPVTYSLEITATNATTTSAVNAVKLRAVDGASWGD